MIQVSVLVIVGLLLSAFFSGSETGFYRAGRVRLVLDSRGGDWISRGLLWLTNNPVLFVATTLIGNNISNYMVSLGVVLFARILEPTGSHLAELVAPVVFTPLVFVYGELLPKNLFYHAPNRLLHMGGLPFLIFTLAFLPLSLALWGFGWLLQRIVGSTPLRVQMTLARKELQQVLIEGKEAGLLHGVQQRLIENLFETGSDRVGPFTIPLDQIPQVPLGATRLAALRLAKEHSLEALPVFDPQTKVIAGYVRLEDLYLEQTVTIGPIQPLPRVSPAEPVISALIRLESAHADMGQVINSKGRMLGVVFTRKLVAPLFDGV